MTSAGLQKGWNHIFEAMKRGLSNKKKLGGVSESQQLIKNIFQWL